jgi:hypothetical protein
MECSSAAGMTLLKKLPSFLKQLQMHTCPQAQLLSVQSLAELA